MKLTSQIRKKKFQYFNLFAASLICSISLFAQTDSTYLDAKGNDFWLVFPPNFHNGKLQNFYYYDDSLYIFITAEKPTIGIIEYVDLSGRTFSQNFSIPDPTKIYTFSIFYNNFELLGYNDNSGILLNRNNSELITKQYFHITSDNEITVYAHNQAHTTSDACLVLPSDILGMDYFIMSYNSDGEIESFSNDLTENSTPSQFVILATEDSTIVTILPKNETQYNSKNTQVITLNKGEAYLVQAKITRANLKTDLTGSEVHSDKPVAVFAGHQRSALPNDSIYSNPSRDYLLEQMPPLISWGQNALLIQFVQPESVTKVKNDLYRILAANDNTELYINDVQKTILNKGEFYEGELTETCYVWASAPILVAQFKKTSNFSSQVSNFSSGDPFEMLISPVEHFINYYKVVNIQARQYSDSDIVYTQHYLTILAENLSLSTVKLDGNPVLPDSFKIIPASNYRYANVRVNDGVHTISCDSNIGVYVYGYGEANSYGYLGGMSMEPISLVGIKENEIDILIDNLLFPNYPNPASGMSKIKFSIAERGHVLLVIYDLLGNQRMIAINENMNPGIYEIDINTDKLEQGIYIYSLNTGRNAVSRLMIIRK